MSWDDLNSKETLLLVNLAEQTKTYRDEVKQIVLDLIDNLEFTLPIKLGFTNVGYLMGIEHENIHIETSSVLLKTKYKLFKNEEDI